eukprot:jgi/Tetstr1/454139/TSEL_041058.t1
MAKKSVRSPMVFYLVSAGVVVVALVLFLVFWNNKAPADPRAAPAPMASVLPSPNPATGATAASPLVATQGNAPYYKANGNYYSNPLP